MRLVGRCGRCRDSDQGEENAGVAEDDETEKWWEC